MLIQDAWVQRQLRCKGGLSRKQATNDFMDMAHFMPFGPDCPSCLHLSGQVFDKSINRSPEYGCGVFISSQLGTSQEPIKRPWFQKDIGQSLWLFQDNIAMTAALMDAATILDSPVCGYSSIAGRFAKSDPAGTESLPFII